MFDKLFGKTKNTESKEALIECLTIINMMDYGRLHFIISSISELSMEEVVTLVDYIKEKILPVRSESVKSKWLYEFMRVKHALFQSALLKELIDSYESYEIKGTVVHPKEKSIYFKMLFTTGHESVALEFIIDGRDMDKVFILLGTIFLRDGVFDHTFNPFSVFTELRKDEKCEEFLNIIIFDRNKSYRDGFIKAIKHIEGLKFKEESFIEFLEFFNIVKDNAIEYNWEDDFLSCVNEYHNRISREKSCPSEDKTHHLIRH
jgi:hypothetical protein